MFLFADGFDSYSATADMTKKWDSINGSFAAFSAAAGIEGGGALVITGASGTACATKQVRAPSSSSNFTDDYVAFWVKISAAPAARVILLEAVAGGSFNSTLALNIESTGRLSMSSGGQGGVAAPFVCDNQFHFVEMELRKTTVSGTSFSLAIDEVQCTSGSTGATGAANGTDSWALFSTGLTVTIDDVVFWDATGSAPNSYPLGVKAIETIRPNGAGANTDFTLHGAATNYQCVNESNADDDGTYVSDATAGHYDLYDYASLSATPASIQAVITNHRARPATASTPTVRAKAKSNSSLANGTSVSLGGLTYKMQQDIFVTDPDTSAAWTGAGVNAAQFGLELVS